MNATMTITGRTVLIGMIAFFGIIFAVNGVFMYLALDTFPGLTSDRAYLQGLQYNKTLADAARQDALGWRVVSTVTGKAGSDIELRVRFTDSSGEPVPYLNVQARLERPATAALARDVDLIASADGHVADITGIDAGRWKLSLVASRSGKPVYQLNDEVFVNP